MTTATAATTPPATAVVVAPIDQIHPADVGSGLARFDAWLRSISDGYLTVERLQVIGNGVPIVCNILAAVDVVLDIKDLIETHDRSVFDYLNLGIDLIGLIPVPPGMGEFRMGVRPVMKLVRQSAEEALKGAAQGGMQLITTTVIDKIAEDVHSRYAGELDKFAEVIKEKLSGLLNDCAQKAQELLTELADILDKAASGTLFDSQSDIDAMDRHAKQMEEGFTSYNARKTVSSLWHYLGDSMSVLGKESANVATHAAVSVSSARPTLQRLAEATRGAIPTVTEKIKGLNSAEVGGLLWLVEALLQAARKRRETLTHQRASGIKEAGETSAEHTKPQKALETTRSEAEAKPPGAGPCHCDIAQSGGSIGYALGDENFSHEDFVLPGPLPIVWERTYRSSLAAYDEGELGARWLTAYTTRFDIHEGKLVYHDASGRSLDYPRLAPGESHDDLSEELTLTQLDEQWLVLTRGHEWLETYEKRGEALRLAFMRDRNGNQVVLDYDEAHRLRRIANAQTGVAFLHDDAGRLAEAVQIDRDGERVATLAHYTYDEHGDLTVAVDRYGNRREYRYRHHLVTRYTDRTGRGMNLEWSGAGPRAKCVREYADDGSHEIRLAWHPDLRLVSVTDGLGNVTRYYFDIKGFTYRVIHPDGLEEWFHRDANHKLVEHTYPDGSVEAFRYDARGNPVEKTARDGSVVRMEYDAKDQLTSVVDPRGYRWKRTYDDAGNLTLQTDPLGHETRYSYNAQGLPTEIVDARGGKKTLAYNEAGQLVRYTDCSRKTSQWRYDGQGRLAESKDAAGRGTTYRYGENGQLAAVESASGIEHVEYDAEGRLLLHADPLNQATRYVYDAAGRVAKRRNALGETLQYRYDPLGRLNELIDENHASYRFRYDRGGRLLEEHGFDGIAKRYSYDAANGRLQSAEEGGVETRFEYDGAGRLTRRAAGESEERFHYDGDGRLVEASNATSRIQRFFDAGGNLVREHHALRLFGEPRSYVWRHEYDEIGTRTRSVRPDGHAIDWLIYGSGHVHGLLLDGEELIQFERDDLHRETQRTLANRITQSTGYDPAGRVQKQTVKRMGAVAPFAARDYRYDAAGHLKQIDDSRLGVTLYQYDPVGRLIEAISPVAKERFAFDPASNIVDAGSPARARSPGMYSDNTLPAGTPRVLGNLLREYAGTHFTYDARGNLVAKRSPGSEQRYGWDGFNRMISASVADARRGGEARYFYDAFGRRIGKEVNGERTVYGWDGDTLAFESAGERSTHYVYEAGTFVPLAQFVTAEVEGIETPEWKQTDRYVPEEDPLLKQQTPREKAQTFYYHCDHLGTPQLLTDEFGEVVWEAQFKAWGEAREVIARVSRATGEVVRNELRFQGQFADEETGLHYNRYRYYDPGSGRFINRDPIGLEGGINLYQYAPNPVEWIDPVGLAKKPPSAYALQDGEGASDTDIATSKIGGGSRAGQEACRQRLLAGNKTGVYKCWRCGQTSANPSDMHLGHKNIPTSKGGNLSDTNVALEGASCNLSAGNSGYVKEGMSCVERGSCGAPYGR